MKTLTKFSDRIPVESMRRDLDRIFDDIVPFSWMRRENGGRNMWYPDTDMSETEDAYNITVDLPGLSKKDIEVNYKDHRLTISGERKEESKEEDKGFLRQERYVGKFMRTFTIPTEIKDDKIKASFKNGILDIEIPKAEAEKPKSINIDEA